MHVGSAAKLVKQAVQPRARPVAAQANLFDRFGRVTKGYAFFYGDQAGETTTISASDSAVTCGVSPVLQGLTVVSEMSILGGNREHKVALG
jgi:hypothetical protein